MANFWGWWPHSPAQEGKSPASPLRVGKKVQRALEYFIQRGDSLEHKNMAGQFAAGLGPSADTAPSPQPDEVGLKA